MSETQFAMISDWMVNGNINDFREGTPGCESVGAGRLLTQSLAAVH
jgi:hypothetical protein